MNGDAGRDNGRTHHAAVWTRSVDSGNRVHTDKSRKRVAYRATAVFAAQRALDPGLCCTDESGTLVRLALRLQQLFARPRRQVLCVRSSVPYSPSPPPPPAPVPAAAAMSTHLSLFSFPLTERLQALPAQTRPTNRQPSHGQHTKTKSVDSPLPTSSQMPVCLQGQKGVGSVSGSRFTE
jgi:hypothetical protein